MQRAEEKEGFGIESNQTQGADRHQWLQHTQTYPKGEPAMSSGSSLSSTSTISIPTTAKTQYSLQQHYESHQAHQQSLPRNRALFTLQQQQELAYLMCPWDTWSLKNSVAMSIPLLVSYICEDSVFLNIFKLKSLPQTDYPYMNGSGGLACPNAIEQYWMCYCKFLVNTMRLSTSAFVLGIIFAYQYRLRSQMKVSLQKPSTAAASCSTSDSAAPRKTRHPPILSVNHLLLVSMMLANKYTEDHPYPNRIWSENFVISVEDLNKLEQAFLCTVEHEIYTPKLDFSRWVLCLNRLCNWIPRCLTQQNVSGGVGPPFEPQCPSPMTRFSQHTRMSCTLSPLQPASHAQAPNDASGRSKNDDRPPGFASDAYCQ